MNPAIAAPPRQVSFMLDGRDKALRDSLPGNACNCAPFVFGYIRNGVRHQPWERKFQITFFGFRRPRTARQSAPLSLNRPPLVSRVRPARASRRAAAHTGHEQRPSVLAAVRPSQAQRRFYGTFGLPASISTRPTGFPAGSLNNPRTATPGTSNLSWSTTPPYRTTSFRVAATSSTPA